MFIVVYGTSYGAICRASRERGGEDRRTQPHSPRALGEPSPGICCGAISPLYYNFSLTVSTTVSFSFKPSRYQCKYECYLQRYWSSKYFNHRYKSSPRSVVRGVRVELVFGSPDGLVHAMQEKRRTSPARAAALCAAAWGRLAERPLHVGLLRSPSEKPIAKLIGVRST